MAVKMKLSEAKEITRNAIAMAIVKNRDKIIALLKKYGIAADSSWSDEKLIIAVLVGIQQREKFKTDLGALLTETTSDIVGFTAEYNSFFFTGAESFFNWDVVDAATLQAGQSVKPASTTTTPKS